MKKKKSTTTRKVKDGLISRSVVKEADSSNQLKVSKKSKFYKTVIG